MSVIGIDLDGTLAIAGPWKSGEHVYPPNPTAARLLMYLFQAGHLICIWTTRPDYVVLQWLEKHGLDKYVHQINESPYPTESGKASFDYYIGDEALSWNGYIDEEMLDLLETVKKPQDFRRETEFSSHNPKPYFQGVGRANVDRFEDAWKAAWQERAPHEKSVAFMTICSHAKPYSKSYIHMSIRKRLLEQHVLHLVDYIHISNAGIIPSDAEMRYPFNAYDWDGSLSTEETTAYHTAALKRRFLYWLKKYSSQYERVVIYLRGNGNTCGVVSQVIDQSEVPVTLIKADHVVPMKPLFPALPDPDDCLFDWSNLQRLKKGVFV